MSADQGLPVTGVSAAAVGVVGALLLALGALFVTMAQWGTRLRRR
ncbi:hypothetical protein R8Z50_25375 [Longispora sp. K20-0274]